MAPQRKPPPLSLELGPTLDSPLQLSSPSTPSSSNSQASFSLHLEEPDESDPTSSSEADPSTDDISKDLEVLEKLRKSVQKNLRLRPIKSASSLPKVSPGYPSATSPWRDIPSPASSTGSVYYTPLSESIRSPPFSAHRYEPQLSPQRTTSSPLPSPGGPSLPRPIDPTTLSDLLSFPSKRPLLIDTRPPASYISSRLHSSINIAIPSLILKRYRKAGSNGFQSLDSLRQFITTEQGKQTWDDLMLRPGGNGSGKWSGNVIVYDEEMIEKDRENPSVTAWALIPLITPVLADSGGNVDYLKNGLSAARTHPRLRTHIVSDEPDSSDDHYEESALSSSKKSGGGSAGLFQLNTLVAARSKVFPEIERERDKPSALPMMPASISSTSIPSTAAATVAFDATSSPPPSHLAFRRPPPPKRPSVPNLRRLDTKSAERLGVNLPKLHIRTPPVKAATLSVPPTLQIPSHPNGSSHLQPPRSPTHLNLMYSTHSPTRTNRSTPPSPNGQSNFNHLPPPSPSFFSTSFSSSPTHSCPTTPRTPRTPTTPMPIPSPSTARPGGDTAPLSTEEAFPVFTISAILPNFLYLGPELTTEEHVKELKALGVKRIINIAAECDDDHGLSLRENFDRYFHIPMRDIVEEENITRGVREACDILDDARLHSAPTYVHCKAGKSRSVTAVIAYLIHANHWTLSRAYSFVLERRKGISPNIGFVSELMTFEEQELGGKSVGVVQPSTNSSVVGPNGEHHEEHHYHDTHGGYGGPSSRRPMHIRESLPPAFTTTQSSEVFMPGPMSAGGISSARVGDSGQEMEIKDATGRYRHARRAPVDETTLQPMRRVSKAGLESSVIG